MKLLILKIDKLNLLLRLVIQSSYANFYLIFSNCYGHRIKSKLNYKHSDRLTKIIFKSIQSSQTQFNRINYSSRNPPNLHKNLQKSKQSNKELYLQKMQEENHRKKLLQSPHNIEMAQFPSYNLQQSRNTNKSLNSLEQQMSLNEPNTNNLGKQQLNAIPEIFLLGGNKDLNLKLWKIRQQKLSRIALNEPIIECENLGKVYKLEGEDEVVALKNITLKGNEINGGIKRGQFVIIRGPSGGGKTTFLNLLGTIDRPTHGHIWVDNEMIDAEHKDQKLSKLRRDKIGIVFQTFNLLALMSAYENIELPMRIKGIESQKAMKERTKLLLKRVGLMERAEHLPSQLSGGEQQRVAIARSLANQPAIILLDEPTGDLDSRSTVQVMNLLLQINNLGYHNSEEGQFRMSANNPGITIVMVTHNEDLQCYGDRVIFFEDGKIKRQVFNDFQFALDPQEYSQFLNTKV